MTVQRYELQLVSASIATTVDALATTVSQISSSGEPFPYTGSAAISGSLTVTGSIFSNEIAFLTASNAVSSSYAVTASFVENGGNTVTSLISGVVLANLEWQAYNSIFKYTYVEPTVVDTNIIRFIPTNDSTVETIVNSGFSNFTIVNNGEVEFFSQTLPTENITGDLQITSFF